MTTIRVCRDPNYPSECRSDDDALNWGNDISDILLSTDEAALERGRVTIDRQYTNRIDASLQLHQTTFIQPGEIVAVANVDRIESGQMMRLSIRVNRSENSISVGSEILMEKNT